MIDNPMRFVLTLWLSALVMATAFSPLPARAQEAGAYAPSDIPLVVIRFNQRKVFYERPLYTAASKAVAIKPGVIFDVVSFVPQGSSEDAQERFDQAARAQQAEVINTLREMGVPPQQIRSNRDIAPDTEFHEIYIYVE